MTESLNTALANPKIGAGDAVVTGEAFSLRYGGARGI